MQQELPTELLPMMEYLKNIPESVIKELWQLQAQCLTIDDPEELAAAQAKAEQRLANMITAYGQPPLRQ